MDGDETSSRFIDGRYKGTGVVASGGEWGNDGDFKLQRHKREGNGKMGLIQVLTCIKATNTTYSSCNRAFMHRRKVTGPNSPLDRFCLREGKKDSSIHVNIKVFKKVKQNLGCGGTYT